MRNCFNSTSFFRTTSSSVWTLLLRYDVASRASWSMQRKNSVLSMEVRCHSHLSGAGAPSMRYFRLSTVCCSSCSALGLVKDAAMGLALVRAACTASAGKWMRLFSCYGSVCCKLRIHIQAASGKWKVSHPYALLELCYWQHLTEA